MSATEVKWSENPAWKGKKQKFCEKLRRKHIFES